jgi:hypothetical protein
VAAMRRAGLAGARAAEHVISNRCKTTATSLR